MQNFEPDTTFGEIQLSSKAYSTEKLSTLAYGTTVLKGIVEEDGELSELSDITPLSIVTIDMQTYLDDPNKANNSNALYLIEQNCLNGFNNRVLSVATPELKNDAANKQYVDDCVSTAVCSYIVPDLSAYISEKVGKIALSVADAIASIDGQLDAKVQEAVNGLSIGKDLFSEFVPNDGAATTQWTNIVLSTLFDDVSSFNEVSVKNIRIVSRGSIFDEEHPNAFFNEIGTSAYMRILDNSNMATAISDMAPVDNGASLPITKTKRYQVFNFQFEPYVVLDASKNYVLQFLSGDNQQALLDVHIAKNLPDTPAKQKEIPTNLSVAFNNAQGHITYLQQAFAYIPCITVVDAPTYIIETIGD